MTTEPSPETSANRGTSEANQQMTPNRGTPETDTSWKYRETETGAGRGAAATANRQPGPVLPVMLDVRGRRCVVIGTTTVADGRADALAAAGATVDRLHTLDRVRLVGAHLVFAATGSTADDADVAEQCESLGIWVNAHDQPAACSFHMAARLTRGPLEMAFGSGGAVPAVVVRVRDLVAELVPADVVPLIEAAARVRQETKAAGGSAFALDWDALLQPLMTALRARLADPG